MQRALVPVHPSVRVCMHISTHSVKLAGQKPPPGLCGAMRAGCSCTPGAWALPGCCKENVSICVYKPKGAPVLPHPPACLGGRGAPLAAEGGQWPANLNFQHRPDTWLHIPLRCRGCRQLQPLGPSGGAHARGDPKVKLPLLPPREPGGEGSGCQGDCAGCWRTCSITALILLKKTP